MFTIGPSLYGSLFCFKKSPLNFTFILALSYIRFAANLLLDAAVVELFFSSDLHDETLFHVFSKYLYKD